MKWISAKITEVMKILDDIARYVNTPDYGNDRVMAVNPIEKLTLHESTTIMLSENEIKIANKINEIIDHINSTYE